MPSDGHHSAHGHQFIIKKSTSVAIWRFFEADVISIVEKRLLTRFVKFFLSNNKSTTEAPMYSSTSSPDLLSCFDQFAHCRWNWNGFFILHYVWIQHYFYSIWRYFCRERPWTIQTTCWISNAIWDTNPVSISQLRNSSITGIIILALSFLCVVHGGTYVLRFHDTALEADSFNNKTDNDIGNGGANESDGDGDGDRHAHIGTHTVAFNRDVVYVKHVLHYTASYDMVFLVFAD